MTAGWVFLGVAALVALAGWVGSLRFIPRKTCRVCNGRALDRHCGMTGKVPRFGSRLVNPDMRKGRS